MFATLFTGAYALRYQTLPLLGEVWEGFCEWLAQRLYPTNAILRRVQAGPFLESELLQRGVSSFDCLTASELLSFAPHLPTKNAKINFRSLVKSLAGYLEERHLLASSPVSPTGELAAKYRRYLEVVRGLAPSTVARDGDRISEFLGFLDYDNSQQKLSSLQLRDIDEFIMRMGRRLGRTSMQKVAAKLRAFLRYLAAEGKAPSGLDAQIESPRCYRGERLPRALPWETVCRIIRSIDRSTPKGCRDYAMLILIAAYGLRVSEIAALRLDDICWRSHQIAVPRPKIGTPLFLPLTDEVADAVIDYLRRFRSSSEDRHLFLRLRIPFGPIKSTGVCDAFDVWAGRAGCQFPKGSGGPHSLRHSLAVHLLRQGTSVKTIGDLLGHGDTESTGVYLRLQIEDLRDVALPLPEIC